MMILQAGSEMSCILMGVHIPVMELLNLQYYSFLFCNICFDNAFGIGLFPIENLW